MSLFTPPKIFFLVLLALFAVSSIVWPHPTRAQIPFGGVVETVIPCTCNWMLGDFSFYIQHLPVAGTPNLIFKVGVSRLYSYYLLLPGEWILGNTLGVSSCWVGFIPFCVPAGAGGAVAPLISIVGTSGLPGATSGLLGGLGNGQTAPINQTSPGPASGVSGTGGVNNNAELNTPENEAQNRKIFGQNGINVVSSANCSDCSNNRCTCVGGMSQSAVDGVVGIREDCPSCQVTINGATEAGHHEGCQGNCVDLKHETNLDAYIINNAQSTQPVYNKKGVFVGNRYTMANGDTYLAEGAGSYGATTGAHWHVQYGPRQ